MPRKSVRFYTYVSSPYGMKVHGYLLYKQIPFELVYVNPIHPEKDLPMGRAVPVLEIDGEVRADSSPIGIWLDEAFPDTPQLMPDDPTAAASVHSADTWITDVLIPAIFYRVHPRLTAPGNLPRTIADTLRLGYCVDYTTPGGLPFGLRYLWPLFINRAGFIRRMVAPLASSASAEAYRATVLSALDRKLRDRDFIAETNTPSLADIGAWALIAGPYLLGLRGMDDYIAHANVLRWMRTLEPAVRDGTGLPPLVPALLNR